MSAAAWGAVLGAVAGLGGWTVLQSVQSARHPSLDSRVLPYVRDVATAPLNWRRELPSDRPAPALLALLRPLLVRSAARLEQVLGGRESIRRRLERAGVDMTVEDFRFSQVVWGLFGFAAAFIVGVLWTAQSPSRALPWLVVCLGAAIVGVLARDHALSQRITRHEQRIVGEFPGVADLLALAVAAGEGPVGALDRVVSRCRGALPDELRKVLADSRTGTPLNVALDTFAGRSGVAIVSRFAEGFAVAIERGTPLVDVLMAQSADVREASKRSLIEAGARKEVAMMVPVVFLIMPVTLLFAFYPGVVGLNLLAP